AGRCRPRRTATPSSSTTSRRTARSFPRPTTSRERRKTKEALMRFAFTKRVGRGALVAAAASLLALGVWRVAPLRAQAAGPGATFSTPILLDPSEQFLYAVNPDNDTVSSISLSAASGTKAQETSVGREPQSLAMTNDG